MFTFHLLTRIPSERKLSCSTPKGRNHLGEPGLGSANETQLFSLGHAFKAHRTKRFLLTLSCGTRPTLSVLKPWCSSQPLLLDNRVNHAEGTYMHKHMWDWVSDQLPLNQWDSPEHLLPIAAGPFAFIDRRLMVLWAHLT